MEHSELFLLLPKYEDVEEQPEYIKSTNIMTEDEILKVVNKIDEICMFISNENYKGYYDAENVSAFLYPAKILKESYPNTITRMRMVMSKWGENWRSQNIIRKSKFPQNPKRSVRFSGKRTKRSVQKRKARNTQKAETKVL